MPSINGGMKLVKYSLFLFNLVFVALAIYLIWTGFDVKYGFARNFSGILSGDDGGHSIPPTIFIAVGFIMFVIAFLGCCGAVTENHCMMMLYSVLVGLILVIQLGAAIAAYAFQDDVDKVLSKGMEESMKQYYNETDPLHNETARSWDMLQNSLECCGVHNYTEWAKVPSAPTEKFIPEFCCIGGRHENCTLGITLANLDDKIAAGKLIYTEGCLPKGIRAFSINHMGNVGLILAAIEVLGIACACMMARSIRFSYETV